MTTSTAPQIKKSPQGRTKKSRLDRRRAVILLNDNVTPMDFVVMILQKFFNLDVISAYGKMLEVHLHNSAVAGIYDKEIAEMKVEQVKEVSKQYGFPLQCRMEKIS